MTILFMNACGRFLLISLIVLLSGCASTVDLIHKYDNPYRYQPDTAVLIVGAVGEAEVGSLIALTNEGNKRFLVPQEATSNINAFAWQVNVGDTFTLQSAALPRWRKSIDFSKPHTLSIDRQGIYYYGTILTKDKDALLIPKVLPELVRIAEENYPYVFNELRPVNFQ